MYLENLSSMLRLNKKNYFLYADKLKMNEKVIN